MSLPFSGSKINQTINRLATYFHAGFFVAIYFYPEHGGDMFLRNVG
jgi:hypothetical protein